MKRLTDEQKEIGKKWNKNIKKMSKLVQIDSSEITVDTIRKIRRVTNNVLTCMEQAAEQGVYEEMSDYIRELN